MALNPCVKYCRSWTLPRRRCILLRLDLGLISPSLPFVPQPWTCFTPDPGSLLWTTFSTGYHVCKIKTQKKILRWKRIFHHMWFNISHLEKKKICYFHNVFVGFLNDQFTSVSSLSIFVSATITQLHSLLISKKDHPRVASHLLNISI